MQTLRASDCGLSIALLSPAILEVIDTLTKAGYQAYIVGGGVRDLLLGLHPKDFDAVTNATPSQIREVFGRRCRIIGRRFELAHVYVGRDMIEVATFRAPPRQAQTSATGMVLRDNAWGTIQQDYARRDFSINTLYYQPFKNTILDFCHAYADIQHKKLKLLGEPVQRFEEDPVRMLRVLRFAAKLNFNIDQSILDVLVPDMTVLLREVSPHRLYDESQKMFSAGHLAELLPLLIKYHVWVQLFADVPQQITPFIERAAVNTDQRIRQGKSINPAFFYAVLMWEAYLKRLQILKDKGLPEVEARTQAGMDVLRRQALRTAIPRYSESFIREVWEMQPRLVEPKARQIPALATHARFRAAYDFLYLREQAGDHTTRGMGQWWHDYQELNNDQKEKVIQQYSRQLIRDKRKQHAATENSHDEPVSDELIRDAIAASAAQPVKKTSRRKAHHDVTSALDESLEHALVATDQPLLGASHPIMRRRRKPRSDFQVEMGRLV
ncbi:polynucleotide adenylyltransferase PcnB [Alkanindiges sp. WGS2144]|uniref:polynucleotide adenylyltransferase PcnB n=1 Tax=Alkanindiges sp. WGS2144 TaxID=3366808 RepID=UPI0037530C3F